MKPSKNEQLPDDIDVEFLEEIQKQYKEREKQINKGYFIHPNYKCQCSICLIKMSDIQINKDLFLDSFYDQESDSENSQQENEESFMK